MLFSQCEAGGRFKRDFARNEMSCLSALETAPGSCVDGVYWFTG